jgi:hypothetical protein
MRNELLINLIVSIYISVVANPFAGLAVGVYMNLMIINFGIHKLQINQLDTLSKKDKNLRLLCTKILDSIHDGVSAALKNLSTNPQATETFLIIIKENLNTVLHQIKLAENGVTKEDFKKFTEENSL